MKIAVLSDVHDNYYSLVKALEMIKNKKCEQIIFLGDIGHARMVKFFVNFSIPTVMIWGNNDGEKIGMMKQSLQEGSNLKIIPKEYGVAEFDSKKIFFCHHPELAFSMCRSGDFDAVFFGHTHQIVNEKHENCVLVNPGEIVGFSYGKSSLAIYDTEDNEIEILEVENLIDKIGLFDEVYNEFNF